jgi:hypothetical protein
VKDLREAPHVLVVPNANGEWWRLLQERDIETAKIVTYRRATLYVQAREHPWLSDRLTYSATFEKQLIDELPIDDLAMEIGRQVALAMREHRKART